MATLNRLSSEQRDILDNIKTGSNIIVDACAGSGKSTTVLTIATENSDELILQVTYNSSLRVELKEKAVQLNISNLKIHTFHSLAVRYYLPTCYTDAGIRHILYNDLAPTTKIPCFMKIVLDETQDMCLIYYQLIEKLIRDLCSNNGEHRVQLVILGDYMQGLYEFKGSDIRFLTMADKIWEQNPYLKTSHFIKCTMKMSYRITNQMRDFVNQVMLGENRLDSCKDGEPVVYIRNSRHNIENTVIFKINQLLGNGVLPSDIFVLGASVKGTSSNIRKMENVLVSQGIPCHVPMLETDKIDERVTQGKVVFSTFHCVKGRQRKYVFVVGFDNSYFEHYARTFIKDTCPNTLYVACTRATHGLILLENDQFPNDRPLEFLKMTHHEMKDSDFIQFKGQPRTIFYKRPDEKTKSLEDIHFITPTDLIKFIPESVLDDISPIIDRIFIRQNEKEEENTIEIPNIIKTKMGYYEEVSDLNGIAIPSIYYDSIDEKYNHEKSNFLRDMILQNVALMREKEHSFLREITDNLPESIQTIGDYVYLANILVATQEKLYFKLKQIDRDEYTWLNDNMVEQCIIRLHDRIGCEIFEQKPLIEETIIHNSENEKHVRIDAFLQQHFENHKKFRFTARTDLITDMSIWELKCTSNISIDHLLQVVIYAWLWQMTTNEEKIFKIFNIKTGEILVLNSSIDDLHVIVVALLKGKYSTISAKTNEEFLDEILDK